MTEPRQPADRDIAIGRIIWISISVIASGVVTYFFSHLMTNSPDVLGLIATIFSIFAGVLIAVISILGDPSMLLDQSWRHSYLSATETQRKIHRQTDVFIIYVLLLVSLFAFMLCPSTTVAYRPLQVITLFLVALAFFASLSLPFTLRSIQRSRLNKAINHIKTTRNKGT